MVDTLEAGAPARPDGTVARTRSIGRIDNYAVGFTNELHRSGPEVTNDARHGSEREIKRTPEQELLDKSRADFKKVLLGDLKELIEEQRTRGEMGFNNWARDAGRMPYLKLFQELTTNEGFEGARGELRHINEDKVDELLADQRGLTRVYDVLRIEHAAKRMAEGQIERMKKNSPRPGLMDRRSVTVLPGAWGTELGRNLMDFFSTPVGLNAGGRGDPNRLARIFTDNAGKLTLTFAGSSGAIGGATIIGLGTAAALTPGGLALVVGAAAAPEIYGAIKLALKKGETYNQQVSGDVWENISGNMAQVEWSRRMHGVDPRDFQRRGRKIAVNPRRRSNTMLPKEVRTERENAMTNAILNFQRANGIAEKYLDPMDVKWILRGELNPPQNGDKFQTRIMEQIDGRGGFGNNVYANLDLYREVQEHLLTQDLDFVFRTLLHRRRDTNAEAKHRIRKRKEALQGEAGVGRRVEEANEQVKRSQADRQVLADAVTGFTEYTDGIKSTRRELDALRTKLQEAEARASGTTPVGAGGPVPPGTTPEQAILNALGTVSTIGIVIDGETIADIRTDENRIRGEKALAYQTYIADLRAAQAGMTKPPDNTEAANAEKKRIDEEYSVEVDDLARRKKILTDLLLEIQTTRRQISEKERLLTGNSLPDGQPSPRAKTAEITRNMTQAMARIESWNGLPAAGGAGPVDLSENALATQGFDELSNRIIATGRLTLEEMTAPDNRKLLLHAMTEARARQVIDAPIALLPETNVYGIPEADLLNPANADITIRDLINVGRAGVVPAPPPITDGEVAGFRRALRANRNLQTAGVPGNWGMTYVDILGLSPAEINTNINAAIAAAAAAGGAAPPANPGIDAIENFKAEATRQLQARQRSADTLGVTIQAVVDRNQAEATELQQNGIRTPELDFDEVLNSPDNYNRINEDIRNRPLFLRDNLGRRNYNSIEELFEIGVVTPGDLTADNRRFIQAELGSDKAWAEIVHLIGQHRNAPSSFTYGGQTGEAAMLLRNREVVTPDLLRRAFSDHFNLLIAPGGGGPPAAPANWEELKAVMRYRMGTAIIPATGERSPVTITPDDLGEFLSEGIYNIFMNRVPTADSAPVLVP